MRLQLYRMRHAEHSSHAEKCRLYNILPFFMFLGTLADISTSDALRDGVGTSPLDRLCPSRGNY